MALNLGARVNTAPPPRIFISPPQTGPDELRYVQEAFAANWIAPVGPNLAAFEAEVCRACGVTAALAVSSGTAALHLAMHLLDVQPGDEVFCSSFTFVASANPIVYRGGSPVFIDADRASWNMDPALLAEALADRARSGKLPRAIVVADIYGQCATWDELRTLAARYDVPLVEDAAESMGATYRGRQAGGFGTLGFYSFNGNKIVTTSGGGMLVSAQPELIERARRLATQSRDDAPHYEHSELGYNYRLSNVLAGIGRGQLRSLSARIERRREIFEFYRQSLGDLPGVAFMPEAPGCHSTRWLTCLTIDPDAKGSHRDAVLAALEAANIEARPLWKPLHQQPLYRQAPCFDAGVADRLFAHGLSLPSGSGMTEEELDRVVETVRGAFQA